MVTLVATTSRDAPMLARIIDHTRSARGASFSMGTAIARGSRQMQVGAITHESERSGERLRRFVLPRGAVQGDEPDAANRSRPCGHCAPRMALPAEGDRRLDARFVSLAT